MKNMDIVWEDFGSGPAVLVLHGEEHPGKDLPGTFAPLAEAGYRVIVARLAPSGGVAETLGLLNALGVGRAVVLGIGRGGSVLTDLMTRHPGRVAAGSLVVSKASAPGSQPPEKNADWREALCNRLAFGQEADTARTIPEAATKTHRLQRMRAWAEGVRSRAAGWRDLRARLSGLQLPPLLEEGADEEEPLTEPA